MVRVWVAVLCVKVDTLTRQTHQPTHSSILPSTHPSIHPSIHPPTRHFHGKSPSNMYVEQSKQKARNANAPGGAQTTHHPRLARDPLHSQPIHGPSKWVIAFTFCPINCSSRRLRSIVHWEKVLPRTEWCLAVGVLRYSQCIHLLLCSLWFQSKTSSCHCFVLCRAGFWEKCYYLVITHISRPGPEEVRV